MNKNINYLSIITISRCKKQFVIHTSIDSFNSAGGGDPGWPKLIDGIVLHQDISLTCKCLQV